MALNLQLKQIREDRGLSQQDMADLLGIKKRTYGSWERGEAMMNFRQAVEISDILRCSLDELAGRTIQKHRALNGSQSLLIDCYDSLNAESKDALIKVARSMDKDPANRIEKDGENPDDQAIVGA